ncbi:MAG: hypothetical protein HYZ44_14435 [Bacteroidetes bacterium]|nr:hypothetical protein [Bacteroidota bacterium]
MKTTQFKGFRKSGVLLLIFLIIFISCNKSEDATFTTEDNQFLNNDAVTESSQEEIEDMAHSLLNSSDPIAGRVEEDSRFSFAYILREVSLDKSAGTITVNFDRKSREVVNPSGCVDSKGNVRKGTITITWSASRWYSTGAAITITFINYGVNGIVISGERRIVNTSTPGTATVVWTIYGTLTTTWPDKTTAIRRVDIQKTWIRNGAGAFEKIVVSQTPCTIAAFSGTSRYGKNYSVRITTLLEYNLACQLTNKNYVPVKGVKEVTVDKKTYTVNYGTGACDNTYSVTLNGVSKEFTAKTDSSND